VNVVIFAKNPVAALVLIVLLSVAYCKCICAICCSFTSL